MTYIYIYIYIYIYNYYQRSNSALKMQETGNYSNYTEPYVYILIRQRFGKKSKK